ncbi:U3 snoRNP protein [Basidiobolus ranarum]|uniref:U3 snoRNP protein n=1 Tax=Basidiobolus ranarum TaxID=34480 RepID=A0ABR2WAU8_9FUNG
MSAEVSRKRGLASESPAKKEKRVKEREELELEALVFGGEEDIWKNAGHELSDVESSSEEETNEEPVNVEAIESDQLFFMDSGPVHEEQEDSDEESEEEISKQTKSSVAWEDEDDEELEISVASKRTLRKLRTTEEEDILTGKEYEQRLRQQFEKIHPTPSWADSDIRDSEDEDDDLQVLRSTSGFLKKQRTQVLPGDALEITRLRNANQKGYSQSVIQSVEFHPNAQVLLTAGFDKTLRLFQIDGKINNKIQSVHFKDLPIHQAGFTPEGNQILLSGRRKYFYSYDVEAGQITKISGIRGREEKSLEKFKISPDGEFIAFQGREGYIVLVSQRTKQWVANLKMNGQVRSIDWSADGRYLYSIGTDTEIYQWDMKTMRCTRKFPDYGGYRPSIISASTGYVACGSQSGVVNIYESANLQGENAPQPVKSIMNLTTNVTGMKFNHDSQILAISSRVKKDQFRLIHMPTLTVFNNWPTHGTPLSYVNTFDFSPESGYLAVGNDKGKVLLYRLGHYPVA